MKIFELWDEMLNRHISYHKTLEGAFAAMSAALKKEIPGLCGAFSEDKTVDLTITYSIKSHEVKE